EVAARIDRTARSDHVLPPARRRVFGGRGGVRRRRQAGEDQYGLVMPETGVAPGLVSDLDAVQRAAAAHFEGTVESQNLSCGGHDADREVKSNSTHPPYFRPFTRLIRR